MSDNRATRRGFAATLAALFSGAILAAQPAQAGSGSYALRSQTAGVVIWNGIAWPTTRMKGYAMLLFIGGTTRPGIMDMTKDLWVVDASVVTS